MLMINNRSSERCSRRGSERRVERSNERVMAVFCLRSERVREVRAVVWFASASHGTVHPVRVRYHSFGTGPVKKPKMSEP